MALSATQIQANIDSLSQAIGQGVRRVSIDGMMTEYGSVDEMIKARSYLYADLAKLSPATAPPGYSLGQYSKDGRGNKRGF
jgi:hypothetical protein